MPSERRGFGPFLVALLVAATQATGALELTPAERAFLEAHPSWKLMGSPAPPFQWTDENGTFRGIAADYRAIIEQRLAITLPPVPAASWAESLEQLRRRECDISLLTAGSPDREAYLSVTKPLLVLNPVIITRRENRRIKGFSDLAGRVVAVPRDWVVHERLKNEYPNIVPLPREDVASGVAAVAVGDAEAFFGDLFSASYAIDRLGLNNLKVVAQSPDTVDFAIAVRNDWPEAIPILNKVIDSITPAEHDRIRRKWISMDRGGLTWGRVLSFALPGLIVSSIGVLLYINRRLSREVAQRAKTEADLRESEERWSFALEGSRDGVWDWNVKTNEVFFSKQWKAMLGYADDELANQLDEWTSRIHPDDLDGALDSVQQHLRRETPFYQVEQRVRAKDGRYLWILARGRIVSRDSDGKPLRMVGTHVDVTAWKRAEEELRLHRERLEETVATRTAELREAERNLREMTNNIPGAVYQITLQHDGTFVFPFCSEGMQEMLGVSSAEAIRNADSVFSVIDPNDLAVLHEKAQHSAKTLTRYVQDLRICQPDGRTWWIRAEADPIRQADGTTLWDGNIMDITERKRLEEELALAKAAAESANKAKSTFLANMSHEIRTPMNAILGFSQLLFRDPELTPPQRQHLEVINRSGAHLLDLINDILEMSKIEAGRVTVHPVTFDLHALLDDLERMFRLRTDSRQLRLTLDRGDDVPRMLFADESKLRQIFINLVGNAVKFTERGGITIRVKAEHGDDDSVRLLGEVEDTGPGVSADELPKLFQQFEQTASGHHQGAGTGLGLSISREFVRLMGGEIAVTSEVGVGTTFRFSIVAKSAGDSALTQITSERRRIVGLRSADSPVRILIADDKVENRELLRQILQPVGFETSSAADGQQAVDLVVQWQPQVVLLDLRMPELDGCEATRKIRSLPQGRGVRILVVTASAFEEDRRAALEAGADDFLRKPFREAELFERIARLTKVEYLYADESSATTVGATDRNGTLSTEDLAGAIPETIRVRLLDAVVRADFDEMLGLIAQIEPTAPKVAAELRSRVERYEYQGLLTLLKRETLTP